MFVFTITSSAYAEDSEVQEVLTRTFTLQGGQECLGTTTIYTNGTTTVHNICEWEQKTIITIPDSVDPIDNNTSTEVEISCEVDNTCEEESVNPELEAQIDEILEPFKDILKRFEDNPPHKPSEKEFYEKLQHMGTCARGVGEATGIQQKDRFAVSTLWVNDGEAWLTAFQKTGSQAKLDKAIEECHAQKSKLEGVVLGKQYENRVNAEINYPTKYHAEYAIDAAVWTQERSNTESNVQALETSIETATNALCDHRLYGYDTKKDYGCFVEDKVDVGGTVSYHSEAYHKYLMYKTSTHMPNVSVIHKNSGDSPLSQFITSQGGYQQAIDAIKWQKHFDLTGEALIESHE